VTEIAPSSQADDTTLFDPGGERAAQQAEPEKITFEQAYEELKSIVNRLDDQELPVHEMFDGFRRGKGLEKALRAYLQEREGELSELEEGRNLLPPVRAASRAPPRTPRACRGPAAVCRGRSTPVPAAGRRACARRRGCAPGRG
jgi:exodeoxyribonuclease VII small subunit